MQKKITQLPSSDDEYWEGSDMQRITIEKQSAPTKFKREGRYAISVGTPYDLSLALDWERFDIVDGVIVVKSGQEN